MLLRNIPLLLLLLTLSGHAAELTPAGLWQTVDDKTHKPRGTIRIYEKNGAFFGKIETSADPKDATERCDKCRDNRKDQPVLGMVILRNMKKNDAEYTGGDILDPDTGTVYRCKMMLAADGKKLTVRGFIGISLLGRSQTWLRQ